MLVVKINAHTMSELYGVTQSQSQVKRSAFNNATTATCLSNHFCSNWRGLLIHEACELCIPNFEQQIQAGSYA